MKGQIPILRIAEQRILTDVAVDAVLACDATHPVASGVAIDVAACEGRLWAVTANSRTGEGEGNHGVLERRDIKGIAEDAASQRRRRVSVERALDQCRTPASYAHSAAALC